MKVQDELRKVANGIIEQTPDEEFAPILLFNAADEIDRLRNAIKTARSRLLSTGRKLTIVEADVLNVLTKALKEESE